MRSFSRIYLYELMRDKIYANILLLFNSLYNIITQLMMIATTFYLHKSRAHVFVHFNIRKI